MNQNTRNIRRILYTLKRQFGVKIVLYQVDESSTDLKTGLKTKTYTTQTVKRAIVLPGELERKFVYDLAFIAANKNFTGGGYFDSTVRRVIIESRDLPSDYVLSLNDQCLFEGQTYEVAKIDKTPDSQALMIGLKGTSSSPVLGAS